MPGSSENSRKISLKKLLQNTSPELFTEFADLGTTGTDIEGVTISGITDNSKEVTPGKIFVACQGTKVDAHDYIEEAIANGASTVILERADYIDKVKDSAIPYFKVRNGRKTLAKLASTFYDHPSHRLIVTGITGTNGKTTTTTLIDYIINQLGVKSGLIGTVNCKINGEEFDSKLTTPPATELYSLIEKMVQKEVKYLTKEVSSHGLKQDRVSAINFDIAGITNISYDHMDFHDSWDDYFKSKTKFFQMLSPDSISVLNADDPNAISMGDKTRSKVITYGISSPGAMITAENVDLKPFETSFTYQIKEELPTVTNKPVRPQSHNLKIRMPGKHNIYNTLLAISVCIMAGFDPEQVIKTAEQFPGLFRRLEVIYKNSFTIIDDCAHNPASIRSVFETISQLPFNRLVIVFAIRGSRGDQINLENSQRLVKWVNHLPVRELIITTSKSHAAPTNQVHSSEQTAFLSPLKTSGTPFKFIHNLEETIETALNEVKQGDLLMILGPYAINEGQEIVRNYLSNS
ncbi:Mur ligase family protein [Natranaerobius thermophilus]|uniref:UDP-N-acetylmuramyl-tripeptide synthetase n=1 Tax=Natranaerobius thermophilus (strain ATCC BAA-1301 / DSM 18059 / JW/NM-WN-LF) TaxID=457570 RepID=B2A327_NATTJ|nr:UDP-N-acetylmuramyl-tripeptide synthetase [Natranaerobius thermophilus]ACB83639.1 UDP-N-acetylmuramyl-tripeptide synthetase [Natranaerobius thermophilus JW/NM-WN-LF]